MLVENSKSVGCFIYKTLLILHCNLKSQDSSSYKLVGFRFSTSGQTLTWIPDTFFTSPLSGTLVDDRRPIIIDRYSTVFTHVLNYLHTKEIHLTEAIGMRGLCMKLSSMESLHSQQLKLVQELEHSSCGNELYYGCLNPPSRLSCQNFLPGYQV